MPQEEYEMSRSLSEGSSTVGHREEEEEEEQLLKDHSDSESDEQDEEWAILVEEAGESTHDFENDHPTLRYIFIGVSIGLIFILFKFGLNKFSEATDHHDRAAEKLYYNGSDYFASTVILISLDGFRPDYLNRGITPNMKKITEDGVMAKYMHPAFPPSTFPNHWTLVTGLYPESHGIVANQFYDPVLDATFIHSNHTSTSDHRWWKGEPIWVTSKMNRKRSGSIMWPGSDTLFNPPDKVVKYNGTMTAKEKMDITLNWLDLPYNERPQIYTVYVPQIDQEGHRGGPYSAKMNSHIKQVDNALGYLIEQIELRHLDSHVHIVIVSDHGMAETDSSRLIYYDDILSKDVLQHVMHREAFPLLDLRPDKQAPSDTIQKMYHQLYAYTQTNHSAHYQVFLKQDIPERYHYKHSDRITPVVAIPDVGYTFVTHQDKFVKGGNHGYDNLADEMRAIFLAKGPKVNRAYREGTVLAPFFNTEVYEFITELLNMDAAPNNGTLRADFPILTTPPLL